MKSPDLPKRVLRYGKDEALPERVPLRAGPLDLIYEQGDLRSVRWAGREILRRVYVAVRDRNWGTVAPRLSQVRIDAQPDSFAITYQVENRAGEIDFRWQGSIHGGPDGTIVFRMDGQAHSTFWRNRIGFCVLHPAGLAGRVARAVFAGGGSMEAAFPIEFIPDQPVRPFAGLAGLAHEVAPGLWAEVTFSGDVFEMEDQRNWTDASYKTFCTPLSLPYPVEVPEGTRVAQSVTLRLRGQATGLAAGGMPPGVTLPADAPPLPFPRLGLGCASHGQELSALEIERLRALHLNHLRVDLRLDDPAYPMALERTTREAQAVGAGLEIALFTTDDPRAEIAALRRLVEQIRPPVRAWLCFPARERYAGGSEIAPVLAAAREQLAGFSPGIPFAAGTNTDYIFFKRSIPPLDLADEMTFAVCPQVHAFDNASLVETLEAQRAMVKDTGRLGKPVAVSPLTLKMRFNPYATAAPPPVPPGSLPPQVDKRQMSLFAAAWTLGSIQALAEGGAGRLTYFETSGWRGVMETVAGSPPPFPALPGAVFPLYHVLAAVGAFAGGSFLPLEVERPLETAALLLAHGSRRRLLAANLTPQAGALRLRGFAGGWRLRRLDEENALAAMRAPETFHAAAGESLEANAGEIDLELRPYALVILDQDV